MATFDRIHRKLLEYCDYDPSHCPVSERILTEYIEQLLLKDEDSMPSEFLNDLENKINVLSILKSKIEKSSQLSEDIDKLWVRWLKRLFRKEECEERRNGGQVSQVSTERTGGQVSRVSTGKTILSPVSSVVHEGGVRSVMLLTR